MPPAAAPAPPAPPPRRRLPRARFLAGYYLANAALLASYALTRFLLLERSDLRHARFESVAQFREKERNGAALLAVALFSKFARRQSADAFLSDAFFFAKSLLLLLVFYADWRAAAYYALAYAAAAVAAPQPLYAGPAAMEHLTPATLEELVLAPAPAGGGAAAPRPAWLVEFFAPWAPQCLYLEPVLAELSLTYACPALRFGKVDVSRWPALAARHRVSVAGAAAALPTLILFENGKEAGRVPHLYEDGRVAGGRMRRADIVLAFDLDARAAGGAPAGASGSGGGRAAKKGGAAKKAKAT
jgi:thiol-disulfide isomerase/thioredoxin